MYSLFSLLCLPAVAAISVSKDPTPVVLSDGLRNIRYESTSTDLDLRNKARADVFHECDNATWTVVETIPENIKLNSPYRTHTVWGKMLDAANTYIHISALYITLTGGEQYNRQEGQHVLDALSAALKRGVEVKIALSNAFNQTDSDFALLEGMGAEIQIVDLDKLWGSGVDHTKLIVVDGLDYYIGSANMDWRSLAEVKELGVVVQNCSPLAKDVDKIWDTYWLLSQSETLPTYPTYVQTGINATNPASVKIDEQYSNVYIGSSPQQANPAGRSWDLDGFKDLVVNSKYVDAEVMDYSPLIVFDPSGVVSYWADMDDTFRKAATMGVQLRFMVSKWENTDKRQIQYLRSLDQLDNIEVRFCYFKPHTPNIPYTHVNHAKFFVTDTHTFVSTSNWQGDYFTSTLGASQISDSPYLVSELRDRFERDWGSTYVHPLSDWEKY